MSYESLESVGISYFLRFRFLSCDWEEGCGIWSDFAAEEPALLARIAWSRGWLPLGRDDSGDARALCPRHAEQHSLGGGAAPGEVTPPAEHHEPPHTAFLAAPYAELTPERLGETDALAPGAGEAIPAQALWDDDPLSAPLPGEAAAAVEEAKGDYENHSPWLARMGEIAKQRTAISRAAGKHKAARRRRKAVPALEQEATAEATAEAAAGEPAAPAPVAEDTAGPAAEAEAETGHEHELDAGTGAEPEAQDATV